MNRELILAHSGGYITARTCSLFGKEAVKTFLYKCSNSGKMNPLHAAPEIPLQKKALQKKLSIFVSKIGPATGVTADARSIPAPFQC